VRVGFIAAEKAAFPVRLLCRTLQVSRAGFYAWQARPPAPRVRADDRLGLAIAAIHAESRLSTAAQAEPPRVTHREPVR
jgi:putative transposase